MINCLPTVVNVIAIMRDAEYEKLLVDHRARYPALSDIEYEKMLADKVIITRPKSYKMRVDDLYARVLGIKWDKQINQWVYVANNSLLVEGAYSLHDVLVAWQKGITALKTMYPEHDRALLLATQFEFPAYFGSQATRLNKNGETAFTDASVLTYDSRKHRRCGWRPRADSS